MEKDNCAVKRGKGEAPNELITRNTDIKDEIKAMAEFEAELEEIGLCPVGITPDGTMCRCPVQSKTGGKDGAYVAFDNGTFYGGWGLNWVTGKEIKWCSKDPAKMTAPEKDNYREYKEKAKQQQEEECRAGQEKAAKFAEDLLNKSACCTDEHPYLVKKGIKSRDDLRVDENNVLLVPVYGEDGFVQSIHRISGEGEKRNLPGGKMKNGYYPFVEGSDGTVIVCEGFATAASLNMATGYTVFAALSLSNLINIARIVRSRFPARQLIICGDDDYNTDGNPGKTGATAVAAKYGAMLAIPEFSDENCGTDFNDLHALEGLEVVRAQVAAAISVPAPANEQGIQDEDNDLYVCEDDGVYKRIGGKGKDGAGGSELQRICSPLTVDAKTRNTSSEGWGRQLTLLNHDGVEKTIAIPMVQLNLKGKDALGTLIDLGLEIEPDAHENEVLHYILSRNNLPLHRCVERFGWCGSNFVLGGDVFGPPQAEQIIFQADYQPDHAFIASGTLPEWQEEVGKLCKGNSRLILAAASAFAAPFLSLTQMESFGVHLRGRSSIGKTVALNVAGSVWGGDDRNGYCRSWRATDNGLEGVALIHNDSLLCLDELGQVDGMIAGKIAYMLANGVGKTRANQTGMARSAAKWTTLFFSSGELALAEKMHEAGLRIKAGQELRLIDIPADAGAGLGLFEDLHGFADGARFADHLAASSRKYYGIPIRAFIAVITTREDMFAPWIKKARDHFVRKHCPAGADGQVFRVAKKFGVLYAAGSLAATAKIWPISPQEIEVGLAKVFDAWLAERGGHGAYEIDRGVEQVRDFLLQYGNGRFEPRDGTGQKARDRAGFYEEVDGGIRYFVYPRVFTHEMCKGFDSKMIASELVRLGNLPTDSEGNPTKSVRINALGTSKRMYVFDPDFLGDIAENDDAENDDSEEVEHATWDL